MATVDGMSDAEILRDALTRYAAITLGRDRAVANTLAAQAEDLVEGAPKFITVEVRTVYGNEMIYPACPASEAFACIAGTRTLPQPILKHIKALGYEIRLAPQVTKVLA